MADHNKIGNIGESIVVRALKDKEFLIRERNIDHKWGEIDIVAEKGDRLHFVEVKSTTGNPEDTRPEEHMHYRKQQRLKRVITTYRTQHDLKDIPFQVDLAVVFLSLTKEKAVIRWLRNIILEG